MTTRASVNLHFDVEDIRHDYRAGKYATLDVSAADRNVAAYLHFADTSTVDKAIAELVALRAEMDPPPSGEGGVLFPVGDDEPAPAPTVRNPPYHMTGNTIGPCCTAEAAGYICNAQEGHDGPDHVAYGSDSQECYRWPVAGPGGVLFPAGDDEPEQAPADGNHNLTNKEFIKRTARAFGPAQVTGASS